MLVLVFHGLHLLHEVRAMALYMDRVPGPQHAFVYLNNGNAEMAVIMGNRAQRLFI